MVLNSDFHKRKSIRLKGFDYSQPGLYFVTMCIKDRVHWFGEITDGKMLFSEIGETAKQCLVNIPKHYPCVRLEQFVVMPNHIHGILSILPGNAIIHARSSNEGGQSENANNPTRSMNVGVQSENVDKLTRAHNVGVQNFEPLHYANRNSLVRENRFQHILPRSLGSIVRGFKIGVRKWCRSYQ